MVDRYHQIIATSEHSSIQNAHEDLAETFSDKEFVTAQQLKDYAKAIAQEYQHESNQKKKNLLLVDSLDDGKIMFRLNIFKNNDPIQDKLDEVAVKKALKKIRERIIHELSYYFDPKEFALIVEQIRGEVSDSKQVWAIQDTQGKESMFRRLRTVNPIYQERMIAAWQKLAEVQHQLKQTGTPCPYIIDVEGYSAIDHAGLVEKKQLFDLEGLVNDTDADNSLSEKQLAQQFLMFLSVIRDCMKGAIVLVQNGLMMQDIDLSNIGIDRQTGRGVLFDMDGLYLLNKTRPNTGALAKQNYDDVLDTIVWSSYPPELRESDFDKMSQILASESEMVWQFGLCLEDLKKDLKKFNWSKLGDVEQNLNILMLQMTANHPEDRPTLEEAEAKLSVLITRITQIKDLF